jgi:deoxyxylulose-5-phosphate synthase
MLKDKRSGLAKNNDNLDAVSITPTLHYKFQGKSDQLDIGLYSMYHQIIVGAWYRGLPIKRYETFYNNESIVGLAGYKWHNMSLTYSFDFTLSSLTSVGTGGGHELNLTYIFGKRLGTKKPSKRMPCPNFYVY